MMLIPCPSCGPRNSVEFHHEGAVHQRPDPQNCTIEEWREYLYYRDNPCGVVEETWHHTAGCRRYFTIKRHTLSNDALTPGEPTAQKGTL